MKNLNRILRLQDSITRLALVRRLIDQAWPEVVGNQPEFSQDLGELYAKVNWLQDIANIKFNEAAQQSVQPTACPECGGETSAKCFDMTCPNYGG